MNKKYTNLLVVPKKQYCTIKQSQDVSPDIVRHTALSRFTCSVTVILHRENHCLLVVLCKACGLIFNFTIFLYHTGPCSARQKKKVQNFLTDETKQKTPTTRLFIWKHINDEIKHIFRILLCDVIFFILEGRQE